MRGILVVWLAAAAALGPETEPWAASWSGGALELASPAPWPTGDHNGSLQSVSCVTGGYRLVFGTAATADNGPAQFIDTCNNGKWIASRMLPDSTGNTPPRSPVPGWVIPQFTLGGSPLPPNRYRA